MFYLLEDNRIVDSEELKRKFSSEAKIGIIDNELIATLENFPIFRSESKIKKQSENVFDLIEIGDLVKLDKTLNQVTAIVEDGKKTFYEIGENKWFSFKELNYYLNNNRLIIYKPDANGNYIKVWEVKENVD